MQEKIDVQYESWSDKILKTGSGSRPDQILKTGSGTDLFSKNGLGYGLTKTPVSATQL